MDLLKEYGLTGKKEKMVLKHETYAIIGACMEVHNTLGGSFSEKVYQDALEVEFKLRKIPYEREKHMLVNYKGVKLAHDFFADFICYDKLRAWRDFTGLRNELNYVITENGARRLGTLQKPMTIEEVYKAKNAND